MIAALTGETDKPESNSIQENIHMGDRSPKSNQKKSNQKQQKTNASNQKKNQAISDKQAAGKKK